MTIFDVIVAGGGPAGATAAKILGEAGVSTLLLDKSAFPRDKPCGGGISARALARFPYLNDALANIPTSWVSKVHFESPSGFVVDYRSPDPLYLMIRRCEFDNLLFSLARPHVEVATGLVRKVNVHSDSVSVSTDTAEYRARMVIGCDGANSVVARASGLRTGSVQSDYAIDMMEETPRQELSTAERDRMYIYYRIRSHYGYGYVFPKASHLNVGVGFKLDYYLANLRGEHYAHHQAFVDDLKSKQLLTGQSNRANFRAFPLPISGPLARTYADRVLLAGDAGGFVNALTAEGIYYAMVTWRTCRARRCRSNPCRRFRERSTARLRERLEAGNRRRACAQRSAAKAVAGRPHADRPHRSRRQPSRRAGRSSGPLRHRRVDARAIQTIDVTPGVAGLPARENADASFMA